MTTTLEHRLTTHSDRRRIPRGGRRQADRPGRFPPVLVADSDPFARRPCVRYLTLFGFQVEEATNGAEAMAVISRSRPHAIIAEITLPGSSRLATIFASDRYVPVIVTTTDDAMAVPPGKASVLVKPFPLATMLDELRHALAQIRIAAGGVLGGPPPVRPGQP